MNATESDNQLITMGMNIGIYTFAKLFSEGVAPKQEAWKILAEHCGSEIEKVTSIPLEDLAMMIQPTVDDMLKKIK